MRNLKLPEEKNGEDINPEMQCIVPPPPTQKDDLIRFISFIFRACISRKSLNLVAIKEGGRLIGETFERANTIGMVEFCKYYNEIGYNIYWSVNESVYPFSGKPSKEDITQVYFAHLDIDPDVSGFNDHKTARDHLTALQTELIEKYKPSLVIDSGNGYQYFWRHEDLVSKSDGEGKNKNLISLLGGDKGTQNVDRLMRVAGTRNFPSKKKLEKGYPSTPSLTKIFHLDYIARFDDELFPTQFKEANFKNTEVLSVNSSLTQSVTIEELRSVFQNRLSNSVDALKLWQGSSFDDNSSVFMKVLNHAAFAFQKNPALILEEIKASPLGHSDWFKARLERTDNIVEREIEKAISSQIHSYDPEFNNSFDLSHDALAIELGEKYFYENARYVPAYGKWYFWNGKRWLLDDKALHYSYIGDFLRTKAMSLMEWSKNQKRIKT